MVLEFWCYTRQDVQRYSRRIAAQFQGIPNGVSLDTNSPEGGRGGPGGLESHQTLEWGWSLRPGVIPGGWDRSGRRGGDWIPGNSRLCSSVQIPQTMAMTRSIPTAARGVDTNRAPSSIPG